MVSSHRPEIALPRRIQGGMVSLSLSVKRTC